MTYNNIFLFFCYSFNLFDNPVLWKKTQHKEESQINLMSNIYKPFVTSDRFSVSFMETKPTYKLELTIMGKVLAHNGVYLSEFIFIPFNNASIQKLMIRQKST